jgi:hypothetical protein
VSLKLSYQGDNGDLDPTSPNPLHSSPPQLVASDSAIFPRQVSPTSFALPSPENTNQAHTQRPFRRQTGHVQRAVAKKEMIGRKKSVVAKAAGFYRLLPTCRHPSSVSTRFRGNDSPQVAAATRNTPEIARELLLPKNNQVHHEKGEIQREKRLAAGRRPTGLCFRAE